MPPHMKVPLRVLIVEDSEFDALLLVNLLRRGGYDPSHRRVETAEAMSTALAEQRWDVVISDYSMPSFSMQEALQLLQVSGLDLPFIIVSGGIGEDTAVAAMKAGAHDYLMKGNLARLVPAVERELRETSVRTARRQAESSLRESEERYRTLWETCTDAVLIIDTSHMIRFANPAVECIFGFSPEEVAGQPLQLLQPETLQPRHQAAVQRFLGSTLAPCKRPPMETKGRHKDGHEISIEISFNDMNVQDQHLLVAFIRDITERKRAEQTIRQNQEQFRVAREIQQRLFPTTAPKLSGFEIAGASFPAEATGGDYFDYLTLKDGDSAVVVGDVTGHGIGPAVLMAETRAFLRILARNRSDLGEILTRANGSLSDDISYERYVTLFLVKLNCPSRAFWYASAGHPPAYHFGADGGLKVKLKRTGIPLGLSPEASYNASGQYSMAPGDLLILLTDGVLEAVSAEDDFFGEQRFFNVVQENAHRPAQQILGALHQAVDRFCHGTAQLDDLTLVIIKSIP